MLLASRVLLRHAAHVCPPARASWITAAANELDCMTEPRESLFWSIGAVQASYKERVRAMSLNETQLPGFVLMLEVLLCFLPSSLLCACAVGAIANDGLPLLDGLSLSSATLIGPIGLLIFGQVAFGIRPSNARWRSLVLTSLAGWTAFVVLVSPLTPLPLEEMSWRDCVLLVLLPFVGAAHYALLEHKSRPPQHHGSSHFTS
jgi:hypothetical protein